MSTFLVIKTDADGVSTVANRIVVNGDFLIPADENPGVDLGYTKGPTDAAWTPPTAKEPIND